MNELTLQWHRLGKSKPVKGFKYSVTVISRTLTEESYVHYFNDKSLRDSYIKSLGKDYITLTN